ncbi:NYN domain-containing protein|uniref:NYN domain-containing protein n=1 Tax=Stenotrophomonas sp. SbOxS2 TaxID=2723885 RepID=UPI0015D15940|nr:NYN domain-containing protein [Stenotrophomonas sp. SbOxS2]NYT99362.1 NYN domain-containing protein [Stenotrophomonas sp. SbOxS2]
MNITTVLCAVSARPTLTGMPELAMQRADTFCLVTSDSDFAYLCRKLRERGASVCIVGESKTPDALRNASDQFFEWTRPEHPHTTAGSTAAIPAKDTLPKTEPSNDQTKPVVKRRPRFLVEAVALLTGSTSDGKVTMGLLGQYLKRTDPAFSPQTYGHSGLLSMVKTYDLLIAHQQDGGHWSVSLAAKVDASTENLNSVMPD